MTFDLFAKCACTSSAVCYFCMSLTAIVLFMAFGIFVAWKPKKVIELQIAFYRRINWKMEPISMQKEIRNTRAMGFIVFILGVLAFIYILIK